MSSLYHNLKAASLLVVVTAGLAGCAQAPTGPSVQALPGPRKSFTDFQQDNTACMSLAQAAIGPAQNQLNQQQALATVGTALLGAAVGYAGGGGGQGALSGAGYGLSSGAAVGADAASATAQTMQQRYDISFAQCMYAKGNEVPGLTPTAVAVYAPQARSAFDPMVRSVQSELVRTGYLNARPDGVYGPMTRSAILSFEQSHGMASDPTASSALLASLRGAPSANAGAVASAGGLVQPVTGARAGAASGGLVSPVSSPVATPVSAPGPAASGLVAPVTGGSGAAVKSN